MRNYFRFLFLAVLIVFGLAACGGGPQVKNDGNEAKKTKTAKKSQSQKAYNPKDISSDGLEVKKFDLNRDQKTDVWKFYKPGEKETILVRKEMDINFDGEVDVWRFYTEAGELERENLDLDFDGRVDLTNFFNKDVIVRKEADRNFDGKPDMWVFYYQGKIVRKEQDTNNDAKVDYWEYYEGDEIDRIGIDRDADGEVDDWLRKSAAKPEEQ